jgi:CelD/BcsL family acetyltransferase involved in cellulose biosynthesis
MTINQILQTDQIQEADISLAEYQLLSQKHQQLWQGAGPFMTPAWLHAWWSCFGEKEILLFSLSRENDLLGVAPLMVHGQTAHIIGSEDLCDYLDIMVLPKHCEYFFTRLLKRLKKSGIRDVILEPVRSSSAVMRYLLPFARAHGLEVRVESKKVSVNMVLPASWDEYLMSLSKKQRHEVRRKFRRLFEAGTVKTRIIRSADEVEDAMGRFFVLFRQSREDKNLFLTPKRERYFRELAGQLGRSAMLNMLEVRIDDAAVAMVFCVDLGETTYLYNNGFNPEYRKISAGFVSKLMTIRKSIEVGMQYYDFLGGDEHYKFQLGGVEEKLASVHIRLDS